MVRHHTMNVKRRLVTGAALALVSGWLNAGSVAGATMTGAHTFSVDAGSVPGSAFVEPSLWVDFDSMVTGRRSLRPVAASENFLARETPPLRLDGLRDEPGFAPFLDWEIHDLERYARSVPGDADAWTVLGVRLFQAGRMGESVEALHRARRSDPRHERSAELLSAIVIHGADAERAEREVREMLDHIPHNPIVRFNAACGYARQSNHEAALYHLGVLTNTGWRALRFHLDDPDLDLIRDHPAFRSMAEALDREARARVIDALRVPRP